jgi:Na+/melibiose symporter-like transporter
METFKLVLFLLAVLTSLGCTLLLYRGYRNTRLRILLWSALCFVCLTVNNLLVFVDLILLPETVDLRVLRHSVALTGMAFLLYGFIRDSE